VDADHDAESWFERMRNLEYDPERGTRCTACFDIRMEVTAWFAAEHGFPWFTTTNATSRWKDIGQVNASGIRASQWVERKLQEQLNGRPVPQFWGHNWQTDEMTLRKYKVSAEQRFYKQEYCGCLYSLRDSNLWRKKEGIPAVKIGGETAGLGTRYFEDPETDAAEESQDVVDSFFRDADRQFDDARLQKLYAGRKKTAAEEGADLGELNTW
jgi:predicted adenine nucleotide alpha hydrolase (AANH) superfamily ATPase